MVIKQESIFSRMQTAALVASTGEVGIYLPPGYIPSPRYTYPGRDLGTEIPSTPVNRHLKKHYLPVTSLAGSN